MIRPSRSPPPGTGGSRSLSVEDVPPGPRPAYLTACGREVRSRGRNSRLIGVASQTLAVRSVLPVRTRDPSGLNVAEWTASVCPLSVRTSAPLFASQTLAVRSRLPVTIRDPSGLNVAEVTALNVAEVTSLVCPLSVRSSAPLFASQTLAVRS